MCPRQRKDDLGPQFCKSLLSLMQDKDLVLVAYLHSGPTLDPSGPSPFPRDSLSVCFLQCLFWALLPLGASRNG